MTSRRERLVSRIEQASSLDRTAQPLATSAEKALAGGPLGDVLSGRQLGHSLHPALVAAPIGAWVTASVVDLTGRDGGAAQRAVGLGVLTALPAALSGAHDWAFTEGAERRVGLVHAAAVYTGIGLQVASWSARRRDRRTLGVVLSLLGNVAVSAGGWLGGHLSYALGVGVDTTAFQQLPDEWTDVASEADVPADGGVGVTAEGVPLLLARVDGRLVAIAARCTHRGAPLAEGEVRDGCVTCPWHGGVFDLRDGVVRKGPPVRPQTPLEVRVSGGRVLVRRVEARTLRANPVGT